MSSTIKVNNISNLAGDNSGIDLSTNDQIILKTNGTSAVTVNSSQATALGGNLTIPNGGLIGSAGDADAISIATNGVVTFSQTPVGAGGDVVKLSSVTTAGATSVDFNSSLITNSYMTYRIIGSNVRSTVSNETPQLLLSVNNGSNFNLTVKGNKYQQRLYDDQGYNAVYYTGNGGVHQMGNNISATSSILSTFDLTVYNTRSTSGIKYVNSTFTGSLNNDGDAYRWMTPSRVDTTTAINFLRCKFSDGNIAGTFTLYGIVA